MNIIVLGPQGSGKGTQAAKISEKFNLFYFEAGKFLRDIAKTNPEIDEMVNKKGVLVPDDQMFDLVKNYLEGQNVFGNIVTDGYPRSVKQLSLIENWLSSHNQKFDLAIFLNIPPEESIRRLEARRLDPKTGTIYNLITNPPGDEVDPNSLVQREDDTKEAIEKRLEAYHTQTAPVIDELKNKNILIEIDGTLSIAEIEKQIEEVVTKTQER